MVRERRRPVEEEAEEEEAEDAEPEEARQSGASSNRTNYKGKKKKSSKRKKIIRFCPNLSNRSRSDTSINRSGTKWSSVSKSSLKRNNDELIKGIAKHKRILAHKDVEIIQLKQEILSQHEENGILRLRLDHTEEDYIRKFRRMKNNLNNALDNMIGLQENITQCVSETNVLLRTSQAARHSGHSSRSSSTRLSQGAGTAGFINFPRFRDASRVVGPSQSPPKPLPQSKVSPMVAGHAISSPRIQLARMDLSNMMTPAEAAALANLQGRGEPIEVDEVEPPLPHPAEEQQLEQEDIMEESPPLPRRTRFNLTVIGEESRVEDSSPGDQQEEEEEVQEEEEPIEGNEASLDPQLESSREPEPGDVSLHRRVRTSGIRRRLSAVSASSFSSTVGRPSLTSTVGRPSLSSTVGRPSLSSTVGRPRLSSTVSRLIAPSSNATLQRVTEGVSYTVGSSSSSHPTSTLGLLRCSPKVDILRSPRHPAVLLSNINSANLAADCNIHISLVDTPVSVPAKPRPVKPIDPTTISLGDFEDPSDSFLESLGCDPMEGPSWLFGSVKKKSKRRSAIKRLSSLLSHEQTSSSGVSLDNSDIGLESSGFIPNRRSGGSLKPEESCQLRESSQLEESSLRRESSQLAESSGFLGLSTRLSASPVDTSQFLQNLEDSETENEEDSRREVVSDEENRLICTQGFRRSSLELGGRTPLREITLEPQGEVLTYNPKLENGEFIFSLKKARILVNNTRSSMLPKPLRLSECYIDLSPGRRMSMEDVLKLGISSLTSPITTKHKDGKRTSGVFSRSRGARSKPVPDPLSDRLECEGTDPVGEPVAATTMEARPAVEKSVRVSSIVSRSSRTKLVSPTKVQPREVERVVPDIVIATEGRLEVEQVDRGSCDAVLFRSSDQVISAQGSSYENQSGKENDEENLSSESRVDSLELDEQWKVGRKSRKANSVVESVKPNAVAATVKVDTSKALKRKQQSEIVKVNSRTGDGSEDVEAEPGGEGKQRKKARSTITKATKRVSKMEATTELAHSDKVQEEEEGNVEDVPEQAAVEEGGRRRRAAAQISFKEPSIRAKMRQGDAGSSSVYSDFKPKTKTKKTKGVEEILI